MVACCTRSTGADSSKYLKVRNSQSVAILGNDGAHISCLCEDEMLVTTIFDGVETLYDCFQRGLKLSSQKYCLGWRPSSNEAFKWMTYNEKQFKLLHFVDIWIYFPNIINSGVGDMHEAVNTRSIDFGSGLIALGLYQKNYNRVGIYSKNRPEYIIADQALYHHSLTCVPLYDIMGTDARDFVINQSELSIIVCDDNIKVTSLLDRRKQFPVLKTLIIMERLTEENLLVARKRRVKILQFHEVEKLGQETPVTSKNVPTLTPPTQSDLCMVCYTSGTTGTPKGAMLTHGNLIATMSGGLKAMVIIEPGVFLLSPTFYKLKFLFAQGGVRHNQIACGFHITNNDSYISYLPLAHIYERVMETHHCEKLIECLEEGNLDTKDIQLISKLYWEQIATISAGNSCSTEVEASMFVNGAHIGFFQGDIKKLMDDIKELRPTIFPSVPRLLNRFYDKVMSSVNANKVKKFLFLKALNSKSKQLQRGIMNNNSLWDRVMFNKIQEALGGRLRLITTGSAPISAHVLKFLRCIVGCPIVEGYGQTENSGVCACTLIGDFESGQVGPPMPCNLIKLVDVPEMNYFSISDKGEVCVKGPNVFIGYLKDKEKTKEVLDSDGWLHTGDVGEWLSNGTLRIIDRKKNIFKLSQGEYIAPEKIENILSQSPWVAQVFVHGDSLQSYPVAIVVPDPETITVLAAEYGFKGTLAELSADPGVKKLILADLNEVGRSNGLSTIENVKDIKLHPEMFSVDNGLLTPTFKLKRFELIKTFAKDIELLYKHSEDQPNSSKF